MKHSNSIFGTENYRGTGIRTVSGIKAVTIALMAISVLAAVYIIANFGELTAKIAIWMVNFLSSSFPVLITVVAIIYFVTKLKWKMRRHFWER